MLMAEWDLLRHAEKDIYVPIQKSPKHVYIPLISVNGMDWGREIICSPLPMHRIGVSPPCNVFKMLQIKQMAIGSATLYQYGFKLSESK